MKQKCLGCGVEKDRSVKEVYPYAEEDGLIEDPIDPMMEIDCQGGKDWRRVTVCFECFHKLSPDLWISEAGWGSLNPIVPFEELPKLLYMYVADEAVASLPGKLEQKFEGFRVVWLPESRLSR